VTRLLGGQPGFDSRQGKERDFLLFTTTSIRAVGSTQHHIKWMSGVLDKMGGTCGTHGGRERYLQGFRWEARR
jgi:hypothetical protein